MKTLDKAQIDETANKLTKLADDIRGMDFNEIEKYNEISISFAAINKAKAEEVCNELSSWGKGLYIYIIQATDETDINECRQQYENAKRNNEKRRAYARLNKNTDSKVLYVGSSSSLGSRIKQHLGFGPDGTFALQAQYWSADISGELVITIWRFPKDTRQDVIQAIEDGLWGKCKPMFGRRGAR